ncbi:MAG: hypothetical protein ACFFDT_34345, partial [Candidatus Hodarchaeota archaeon]
MSELSPEEMRKLLYYMDRVMLYDRVNFLLACNMITLLWGLLFIGAGISETLLNLSTGYEGTIIVWIVTLLSLWIVDVFSKYQLFQRKEPMAKHR